VQPTFFVIEAVFRRWLEVNHETAPELLVGFWKKGSGKAWFEAHESMESAIVREKRIKRWPRVWKYDLVHKDNPAWRDLAEDFGFEPLPLGSGDKVRRVPAQGRDDEV